ncbi:transposase [Sediminihabitans luteus]|uniref:transposase n=1 Tax=Sediminihabitans luteus TaxID=1138585 RepID=UPI0035709926
MARKTYTAEFRRDAVELYRSTPTATVAGMAADLGIKDAMLSGWIKLLRPGFSGGSELTLRR